MSSDEHPLMKRFHMPSRSERPVVVLPPCRYDAWLDEKSDDEANALIQLFDDNEFSTGLVEISEVMLSDLFLTEQVALFRLSRLA